MTAISVFLALAIPTIVLLRESKKLTPVVLTCCNLSLILLGYVILDALNSTSVALTYGTAIGCFICAYWWHQKRSRAQPIVKTRRSWRKGSGGAVIFTLVVLAMTLYHLLVGGIPILSKDVEVTRFDFTSSGLFGIPGRMYLFGLPFAVLLVSVAAARNLLPIPRRFLYGVWVCYVFANLLGGFKGGMVNVILTMLLVASVSGRAISLRQIFLGRRIFLVVAALLFAVLISFTYQSVGVESFQESLAYLSTRATVLDAQPGYTAMDAFGTRGTVGEQFAEDFRYFIQKYFSFTHLDQDSPYTFEKVVSSIMTHTPLSDDSFIVPVTLGAFPEFWVNFGIAGALGAMALAGLLFSHLFVRSQTCNNVFGAAVYAFGLQMMQAYIVKGGLMYAVFNFTLMSILLACIYFASERMAGLASRATREEQQANGAV